MARKKTTRAPLPKGTKDFNKSDIASKIGNNTDFQFGQKKQLLLANISKNYLTRSTSGNI